MTTLDDATQQSLQTALRTYVHTYGGKSAPEIQAIAGAILTVKEKSGALISQGLEIEQWVDTLVSNFDLEGLAEQAGETAALLLANQTKHWRETIEVKATATVDAFIQKYAPDLNVQKIQTLTATVLPIVEDAKITRAEAARLIQTISKQIDVTAAINRVIDPKWTFLAEKAMQVLQHQDLEASATEVMHAYVHKFEPAAIEIGEDLIEQAVQAVTNSKVKLGLDVEIDPDTRQLIVKQVMLKFNLMEAAPQPSKTALEIAQELHEEVSRYRREQGLDTINYIPEVTVTDDASGNSQLGGELSVGIELQPTTSTDDTDQSSETS
ncbi:MAG: hypothetical protein ACFBSG_15115 [Leptolyngbyaceae cyanobacterium]